MFSDVDGRWVDATEIVQQFDDSDPVALGCDAFWNTFWNINQLWNLGTPEFSSRWVKSQLSMYDANGWLAKGPAGMEYVPVDGSRTRNAFISECLPNGNSRLRHQKHV